MTSFTFFRYPVLSFLYLLCVCTLSFAAANSTVYSSQHFINEIRNSQELNYAKTIHFYDSSFKAHQTPQILIEKCRFMEKALYDPETENNPKYAEWEICYKVLLNKYPDNIDVVIYRLDNEWGDSAIDIAQKVLSRIKKNELTANSKQMAKIYENLAYAYSNADSIEQTIKACDSALGYDDTTSVHLLLARKYVALGKSEKVRAVLLKAESRFKSYELKQAAELLVQVKFTKDALRFYATAMIDTSSYTDFSDVALAYEQAGYFDSARIFNMKALSSKYDSVEASRKLFEFDLRHSSGKIAKESYMAFRKNGYKSDPLLLYRLRLFIKDPLQSFKWRDFLGFATLLSVCLLTLIIPYLWILPLHYLGNWFSRKRSPLVTLFSMRHLWIVSAGLLVSSILASGLFQTRNYSEFFDDSVTAGQISDIDNMLFIVAFCGFMALLSLAILIKSKRWSLLMPRVPLTRTIGLLLVCFLIMFVVRKVNFMFFPELIEQYSKNSGSGAIIVFIKSTLLTIGLFPTMLIVAFIVPFYEEFVFRGIAVESLRKYFPFWLVNILQAIVFALFHDSLKLFPFYLSLGMVLGWLYKNTRSLFVSIVLHSINNLFAVLSIWKII